MRALAYLLGARALDIARDAGPETRPMPEVPLGPLATTPETASAWRRWSEAGGSAAAAADPRPSGLRPSVERTPTPA